MGYLAIATTVLSEVGSLANQRSTDSVNSSLDAMNGTVLQDITLSSTPTDVAHHLGLNWTEFQVLKKDAPVDVYHAGPSRDERKFISLASNGAVTVTLRIR